MLLIIKAMAGMDLNLSNGKVIRLKGQSYLNNVSSEDFKAMKEEYPVIIRAIEEGYILVTDKKTQDKDSLKADLMNSELNKQEQEQKKNAKKTKQNIQVEAE